MSVTGSKAGKRAQNGEVRRARTRDEADPGAVLTLSEAAAYLRVAENHVQRLAEMHELPGRRIGGEWRFLRAGLQDWLRKPPGRTGKEAFLALAGAWRDDPDVEQIVRDALRRRGRPGAERKE
jgi:excisionase family DNA binding protein